MTPFQLYDFNSFKIFFFFRNVLVQSASPTVWSPANAAKGRMTRPPSPVSSAARNLGMINLACPHFRYLKL